MKKPYHYLPLLLLTLALAAIFSSCSRSVSKVSSLKQLPIDTTKVVEAVAASPIGIDTLKTDIRKVVGISIVDSYYNNRVRTKVGQFYLANGLQTKWLYNRAPSSLFYVAIDILKNASMYGLSPDDYNATAIEERLHHLYQSPEAQQSIVDLDIDISQMVMLFTTHLIEGRIKNVANGKNVWKRSVREYALPDTKLIAASTTPDELLAAVSQLHPANEQYLKLQQALSYYRQLEGQSPKILQAISVKSAIKPGERNAAVPLIRKKLSLTDMKVYPMVFDSVVQAMDSVWYDATLTIGVKEFQARHGLEPDGVIGEKTLKFMNQSFHDKAEIIALNMERLRWSPEGADNYISVNVPEYKLRVYDQQKKTIEMKVIVGASNKATPIFSDELEHIVFSPTWTVPTSIIKEEIIPNLMKDSLYYSKKNFVFFKNEEQIDPIAEVWKDANINPYQYRVVQNPGTDNSLGSVKFMMPNNMSVYLHDTPNHKLFSKDYRALSHGCIRLDEPAKFAEYLLRDQKGWTPERIGKAMGGSAPATIHLKKHYQVFIEYRTAWVDDDGVINFREDIYGHDKAQLKQMKPAAVNAATASVGN